MQPRRSRPKFADTHVRSPPDPSATGSALADRATDGAADGAAERATDGGADGAAEAAPE